MATTVHISYQESKPTKRFRSFFSFRWTANINTCRLRRVPRRPEDSLMLRSPIVPTQTKQLTTSCLFQVLGVSVKCLVRTIEAETFQRFFFFFLRLIQAEQFSRIKGVDLSGSLVLHKQGSGVPSPRLGSIILSHLHAWQMKQMCSGRDEKFSAEALEVPLTNRCVLWLDV